MPDLDVVLEAYGRAWREPDDARRLALLKTAWSDHGLYQDPSANASGRAALSEHISGVLETYPGCRVEITSGVDRHHDKIRFTWHMRSANGAIAIKGIDFGEIGADGRLTKIIGFFGPVPAP